MNSTENLAIMIGIRNGFLKSKYFIYLLTKYLVDIFLKVK